MYLSHHFLIIQFLVIGLTQYGYAWSRTEQTGKLKDLDVICGKDHMTVRALFDGPFNGIVSSKRGIKEGQWGSGDCVYVKSHSGVEHATFKVMYNECGTKPDIQGKYYENTIVIQYGTDIIEAFDEAKRLRCEWFEAYEKPATFRPAIPVADLDVVEMNFQGDDIDCFMEIQEGKGPWSRPVNRIVPVGHEMTIVIAISDQSNQFDMRVKSCFAHDGIKPPVQLTDQYGCVLRKTMLSEFKKIRGPEYRKNLGDNAVALNGYLSKASVISYAHFYAFKFPDSMSVQMQCTVEVCRNGCPNACDNANYPPPQHILKPNLKISFNQSPPNRKNGNRQEPNRGNARRNQNNNNNYDHSRDLVLDDDVALTASESKYQPAAILPLESQNHRRVLDEDTNLKENSNTNNSPIVNSMSINNENEMKLNNDQIHQLVTTTSKPIYRLTEDALQHENNKLISELKHNGVDINRLNSLADTLLNNKQSNNLDNLPSLTSHIQRLQNDHLAQVFKDERLRELALESGLKLNGLQLNELLPQAQPLKTNNESSNLNNHHNSIDFDSLLNSVNNLISSSTVPSSTVPFIQTTTTTTQSPVTENKDIYLEEETGTDDINLANTPDDTNDGNMNIVKQNENQDQVNVRILNNHQDNQFKHEPLSSKNQPSYIIENTPSKPPVHQPNHYQFSHHINLNTPNKQQINHKPSVVATSVPPQPNLQLNNNNINKNKNHQLNNKFPSINYQTGPPQLHQPNLIQPLINHQHHHQPFHFQYLPATFNNLPLNTLPGSINLNNLNSLNTLPINLLTNAQLSSQLQTPVIKPVAVKQTNKLANLFKQNSLTQYVNTLFKKDASNPAASLLSLFSPATNRALRVNRVSRNARMQIPNKLNLIKLKRTEPSAEQNKIRLRRSTGSHVNLKQEFQVVTPLEMQFNNDDFNSELNQPELLKGKSNVEINETKSLICLELKSTLILALLSAVFLLIILILTCIFMLKRYKKLESN